MSYCGLQQFANSTKHIKAIYCYKHHKRHKHQQPWYGIRALLQAVDASEWHMQHELQPRTHTTARSIYAQ
jgi:hypothetical protein